ncbi:helicase-exonuclease AddAB subunit AddB, partial [Paenibacillus sepulcri]|nr:helicase-exonuclease AddAB subunit AddB [Paenibacillus sepulcri]
LAFRVMQETGGTALVPISENGKNMLLYKIVHRLHDDLQLYQGSESQPGFIERLGDLMTEWKRYGIEPEDIETFLSEGGYGSSNQLLSRKLHDLRLIGGQLVKELTGLYIDAEDYLSWLIRGFHEAPSMRQTHIWVDGFHGFTPKEFEALEALMRQAEEITVTLTLDRVYGAGEQPHELDMFRSTAETFLKLRELALANNVPVAEPVVLNGGTPWRYRG